MTPVAVVVAVMLIIVFPQWKKVEPVDRLESLRLRRAVIKKSLGTRSPK